MEKELAMLEPIAITSPAQPGVDHEMARPQENINTFIDASWNSGGKTAPHLFSAIHGRNAV